VVGAFPILDLERQRLEEYARDQLEVIRAERRRLDEERRNAEAELDRRREELEQRSQALLKQSSESQSRSNGGEDHAIEQLRTQCFEYQFQIELLQTERDAAWIQSRKARGRTEVLQGELDATRLQLEVHTTETQRRIEELERERNEVVTRLNKWRLNTDEHVDLSGPPSTLTNLTPETFGLEHTDLKLADIERDGLREQLAQLRNDWDRHDVEFAQMRLEVQNERAMLATDIQSLHLRELAFEAYVAGIRRELALERAKLSLDVQTFHQQMERDCRYTEARAADLRRHERDLRLRESELREFAQITESECAQQRARLTEERLRIARLREALRLEREQSHGGTSPG
jgi:hypothetical protein